MAITQPKRSQEGGKGVEKRGRDFDNLTIQVLVALAIAWAVCFLAVAVFDASMPEALETVVFSPFLMLSVVVALIVLVDVIVPPSVEYLERLSKLIETPRSRDDYREILTNTLIGVSAAIGFVALCFAVAVTG